MVTILNQKQITLIESIIKLASAIYDLYDKLYIIELAQGKDNKEYQEILKKINSYLELEEDLFQKINDDSCLIEDYIDYIDQTKAFSYFTDYNMLMNIDKNIIIKKHIYNLLMTLKEKDRLEKHYENTKIQDNKISYDVSVYLTNQIHDDIERIFIYLTEKAISNEDFEYYKERLQKFKYILNFLNRRLSDIRKNHFKIQDEINLYSLSLKTILNAKNSDYLAILTTYFKFYLSLHLKSISALGEEDYYNNDKYFEIIIEYLIMMSYFEVAPDNELLLKSSFYGIIKEDINNPSITKLFELFKDKKSNSGIKIIELKGIYNDKSSK